MPYTTVVAGTAITASWGNANVRDQVVTPFASAAARTAAIGTPVEGMVAWLSDVDRLEAYDNTSWVPVGPHRVGGSVRTSDVTMTTTETLADSATVTIVAGRRYEVLWSGSYNSSAAGDSIDIRLRYAAGGSVANTDTLIKALPLAEPAANHNLDGSFSFECTGIAAGQTTFGVFAVRIAGSGTVHMYASAIYNVHFFVKDIGT
jgi:hypothetical protein